MPEPRILTIDSASGACSAGVVYLGCACAQSQEIMPRGPAARLPGLVAEALARAGAGAIGIVAVTVGPGSFTGLRAALALAHGLAAGWGCPIVGVTVPEALDQEVRAMVPGRPVWVAMQSRPGRVFLAHCGKIESCALDDLPRLPGDPVVTGNAAGQVADRLGARGETIQVVPLQAAQPVAIAMVALQRRAGTRSALLAQPLYVDAPRVVLPVGL